MFGLTADEAETVQTDPDAAVQLLVIRQLEGWQQPAGESCCWWMLWTRRKNERPTRS